MRHTPGPWIIATSCSYRRILSERGDAVCEPIVQRSDGHPDLHFRNGGFTGPDARLIAAAPELLEALESALACGLVPKMTAKDGGAAGRVKAVQAADKVRAAIAKAKGE